LELVSTGWRLGPHVALYHLVPTDGGYQSEKNVCVPAGNRTPVVRPISSYPCATVLLSKLDRLETKSVVQIVAVGGEGGSSR